MGIDGTCYLKYENREGKPPLNGIGDYVMDSGGRIYYISHIEKVSREYKIDYVVHNKKLEYELLELEYHNSSYFLYKLKY